MALKDKMKDKIRNLFGEKTSLQGRGIYPEKIPFLDEEQILDLATTETLRNLYLGVWYVYGAAVEGDIAEFGTMTGTTAQAIARAINAMNAVGWFKECKKLHLFDSFQGLPHDMSDIDRSSPHVKSGVWSAGTCRGVPKEALESMIRAIIGDNFRVYDGWFADTVRDIPENTKFSMIHLDADLYQSTMDALDPCFARGQLSKGALILFDDWNCNRADPRYGERRAWRELVEKYSIECSDGGSYSWNCQKFLVHDYDGAPR